MAEIPISQEEIHSLGQQLDEITGDSARALLSGIIALAAQAIQGGETDYPAAPIVVHGSDLEPPVVVEVQHPLPSFQEQIAQAFTPGVIDEPTGIEIGHVDGVRVGHGPQP
ncbi:hypothetical protein ACFP2T_38730 [Plantactinospora solaniradicis]|uniref:Uncharacterized protein n=1 Tax=Plantactinospora solaniradicis TaxID=1723736 RepID=A0ABW1KK43_9ACTN